jgi:hypothetical protein
MSSEGPQRKQLESEFNGLGNDLRKHKEGIIQKLKELGAKVD